MPKLEIFSSPISRRLSNIIIKFSRFHWLKQWALWDCKAQNKQKLTPSSEDSTQEVGRNTRLSARVTDPALLSCSSRFLCASQQNRAQSTPLYLLNICLLAVLFLICIEKFVDDRILHQPLCFFSVPVMSLLTYLNLFIKQYSFTETWSYKKEHK